MNSVKLYSAIVSVLFNYLLYGYLHKLEKIGCDCSNTVKSNTISSIIIVNYILIFGVLFVGKIPPSTGVLASILSLVFAVCTFLYLHELKVKKCKCSESLIRDIYYYYYLIIFLLYTTMLSLIFLMIIAILINDSTKFIFSTFFVL